MPKLAPGLQQPCVDFPSFKWLSVASIIYDKKVVNKVPFKRVILKIPSCIEDQAPDNLEVFVSNYVKQLNKEMYLGFPYQLEAFPFSFENSKYIFTIYGDIYTNTFQYHKEPSTYSPDEFSSFQRRKAIDLQEQGFAIDGVKTYMTAHRLKEIRFDQKSNSYYKIYDNDPEEVPLVMVMRRRDNNHYLNVNMRVN